MKDVALRPVAAVAEHEKRPHPLKRVLQRLLPVECVSLPGRIVVAPFRQLPCLEAQSVERGNRRSLFNAGQTRKASPQSGRSLL
jgi:hypothetical protein